MQEESGIGFFSLNLDGIKFVSVSVASCPLTTLRTLVSVTTSKVLVAPLKLYLLQAERFELLQPLVTGQVLQVLVLWCDSLLNSQQFINACLVLTFKSGSCSECCLMGVL